MDDCGIVEELGDLRLAVMGIGEMLMDCATVAVALHSALQGGGSETNIVYIATLASVVRTSEMIHYIGLMLLGFPWSGAVPHKEGGCEVGLTVGSQHELLVRCYGRGASFDDASHSIALLLVI